MIYLTGDTHGNVERILNPNIFSEKFNLCKDDYVIICGDFGIIWDYKGKNEEEEKLLDRLERAPYTTLFLDGNHENFDRLNKYPVEIWNGGEVHKIRPNIIHLMRGQVFNLQGKKFFTFGGAQSHDVSDGILNPNDIDKIRAWNNDPTKMFRINHISWWKEELPSDDEMLKGLLNLKEAKYKVDFVLTHCAPISDAILLGHKKGRDFSKTDILTRYLEGIKQKLQYTRWFFGHYHLNDQVNNKDICIYEQIIRIL